MASKKSLIAVACFLPGRAKDLSAPPYIKTPFELQPEDGFINKPKHVAYMMLYLSFNYNSYNDLC